MNSFLHPVLLFAAALALSCISSVVVAAPLPEESSAVAAPLDRHPAFGAGGLRLPIAGAFFFAADFHHLAVLRTHGELQDGARVPRTFDHEQKGDVGTIFLGAGFQF